MSEVDQPGRADRSWAWMDLLILFALAGAMALWTWGAWPDALIDWGTQLYLAWQVSIGKALYRDIAYFNGPISIYFNAILFKLFGVNQPVIWFANFAILGAIIVMLYWLLRDLGGRLAALVGGIVFVTMFAFSRYVVIGNYNYITPYTQEMTHGVALNLLAIILLRRFVRRGRIIDLAAMGFVQGLCFLTKAEVFLPGFVAIVVGMAMTLLAHRHRFSRPARLVAIFLASALAAPAIAVVLLSIAMPFATAVRGVLGSWPWMLDSRVRQMSFYRWISGTNDLAGNLKSMLFWLLGYLLLFGGMLASALFTARLLRNRDAQSKEHRSANFNIVIAPALFTAIGCYLAFHFKLISPTDAFRPLPLIIAILFVIALWQWRCLRRSAPTDDPEIDRLILRITVLIFAGVSLVKIALWPRIWHYGFVLAMPATMLLVEAITSWIPKMLARRGANALVFTSASIGLCAAMILIYLQLAAFYSPPHTVIVGAGGDAFVSANFRGGEINDAIADIQQLIRPDQTLAVVPQGLMINYLTRRSHPNRFVNLMQPEVITSGEDVVLQEWQTHPPDFVLLTQSDVADNGFRLIDDIYGGKLLAWIRRNYSQLQSSQGQIGMTLMKRRPQPDPS